MLKAVPYLTHHTVEQLVNNCRRWLLCQYTAKFPHS